MRGVCATRTQRRELNELTLDHLLAEGAGAAALAGVRRLKDRFAGKNIAVILTGCNIDQATLRRALEVPTSAD